MSDRERHDRDEAEGPASHGPATLPSREPVAAMPRAPRRSFVVGAASCAVLGCAAYVARRGRAQPAQAIIGATADAAAQARAVRPPDEGPTIVDWPPRRDDAPSGRTFAREIKKLEGRAREVVIARELLAGNVPSFLRRFVAVPLPDGAATVFVLPDYVAVGSDDDFLRIPMMPATAELVAERIGCVLPTRRIVDAVHRSAALKLAPEPLDCGPEMMESVAFVHHNEAIEAQRRARGGVLGALTAGHKKDIVLTPRLATRRSRVAIYGMHKRDGHRIQSLSLHHRANYVDYAHGVRFVAAEMLVAGERRRLADVMTSPQTAALVSDEGPLESARYPRRK